MMIFETPKLTETRYTGPYLAVHSSYSSPASSDSLMGRWSPHIKLLLAVPGSAFGVTPRRRVSPDLRCLVTSQSAQLQKNDIRDADLDDWAHVVRDD